MIDLPVRIPVLRRFAAGFGLLCFLCCLAAAQTETAGRVTGQVTDPTGAAISAAKVTLSSSGFQATQFTDARGRFVFDHVPGREGTVQAAAAGFESKKLSWQAAQGGLQITLAPAGAAEEVTVTANRMATRVVETPTSVVVLAPQDIAATAALTTDAKLRQVAGFSLFRRTDSRTANPTSQGVSLRGLGASGASRALVLADGFPLNDPFGGWVYWDRIPTAELASLEVANGGASHLYGSDALGGVVNLLRQPVDRNSFSLETSYGNENTPDVSFAASRVAGNWAGSLSGELFRSDGYIDVPLSLRGAVDTPVNSKHAAGEATVERKFGQDARVFARGSLLGEERQNGTPLTPNRTTIRELDLGANWNSQRLGSFTLRSYVSRQVYNQNFSAIALDRNSESLTREQRVPAQQVGFSAQWTRSLGARQNLVAGGEEWNVHGESDEVGFSRGLPTSRLQAGGRENNWGGYGEDMVRITSRTLLTVSGRVDRWLNFRAFSAPRLPLFGAGGAVTPFPDRSESFFSPRLAILQQVTSKISLTGSAYRSFRAPTLNELYRSFRVGNIVTQANDQLLAERLTGAEAGAIVTGWDQHFLLRGNIFWNDITRPVANVTLSVAPGLITRQRQNLGRARSRGVEVEADERLSPSLTFSGMYEYTDATVASFPADPTLVGLWIPQAPRHQFTLQARYVKPFLLAAVQGRYVGAQFDDDRNLLPLERYFALDAIVSHPLRPGIELFVAAENLLNQQYQIGRTPVLTVGPPILARAGLRLRLGER
jgi:outer membrane receptor protein involved in Fe transport